MITLTREEAQQVLDALEYTADYDTSIILQKAAIETLRARLSAPEPEPVAWISIGSARMIHWTSDKPAYGDDWEPLYTAPPQREWVGLTDEEMMQIYVALKSVAGFYSVEKYARAIEVKLKEKNSD